MSAENRLGRGLPQNPQPETDPINPIELTEDDKTFLRRYIGRGNGEYFVRTTQKGKPTETELWYLTDYCLGRDRQQAVQDLQRKYELPEYAAHAAWLFTNRYPVTATVLLGSHNFESAEMYTARVRQVTNPGEELGLEAARADRPLSIREYLGAFMPPR